MENLLSAEYRVQRSIESTYTKPPIWYALVPELGHFESIRAFNNLFKRENYKSRTTKQTEKVTIEIAKFSNYLIELKSELIKQGIDYDSYRGGDTSGIDLNKLKIKHGISCSIDLFINESDFKEDYQLSLLNELSLYRPEPAPTNVYPSYYNLRPFEIERFKDYMNNSFIPGLNSIAENECMTSSNDQKNPPTQPSNCGTQLFYDKILLANFGNTQYYPEHSVRYESGREEDRKLKRRHIIRS